MEKGGEVSEESEVPNDSESLQKDHEPDEEEKSIKDNEWFNLTLFNAS